MGKDRMEEEVEEGEVEERDQDVEPVAGKLPH